MCDSESCFTSMTLRASGLAVLTAPLICETIFIPAGMLGYSGISFADMGFVFMKHPCARYCEGREERTCASPQVQSWSAQPYPLSVWLRGQPCPPKWSLPQGRDHTSEVVSALCFDYLASGPFLCLRRGMFRSCTAQFLMRKCKRHVQ